MTTQLSPASLDRAFALLGECAAAGDRCPVTSGPDAHPFLRSAQIGALARQGRIFIEISGQNFRRITILSGPHAGKSTGANPDKSAHVWQTVGKEGTRVNGKFVDHGAASRKPSAPRPLTRSEFFR